LLDPKQVAQDIKGVGLTRGQVILAACNGGAAVFSSDMKQVLKLPSAQQLANALGKGYTVWADKWIHSAQPGTFREIKSFFPPSGTWISPTWTPFEAGHPLPRGEIYGPMLQ
jgi:hypothetical protein